MPTDTLLNAILLGVGATLFMDAVAAVQKHILSQPTLDYAMMGRWLGHLPRGRLFHSPIAASEPIAFERPIGWVAHYLIGILFAWIFLLIMGQNWLQTPSFFPAVLFGMVTLIAPFFILQPGLGAGLAARRTPTPNIARLRSFIAHLSFGIGLWVTALILPL